MKRLENKVALITGGASGLGKAMASCFHAEGAQVIISDIQPELGEQTAAENGFAFFEHDVSKEDQWLDIVARTENTFGALNILVNNAGIVGPLETVNPENTVFSDWKNVFAVNVDGVFLGCKTAIPAMRRAGVGSIINMSSVAGLFATPYATAYGASKATVRQLTKSVAQHCAKEKLQVRCNSIHPGVVRTALWDKAAVGIAAKMGISVDDYIKASLASIPLGDFTRAEDVAAVALFLASDDARHMTGESLTVDGGLVHCDTFAST